MSPGSILDKDGVIVKHDHSNSSLRLHKRLLLLSLLSTSLNKEMDTPNLML